MGVMSFLKPRREDRTKAKSGVFAALDIGASKIACFIVKTEQTLTGARPRVIGVGHQSSRGVRAGAVVDMEAAAGAIRDAVEKAERMAGHALTEVTLVASAGFPSSTRLSVEAPVSSQGEIADRDLRRVLGAGLKDFDQPGRVMLHALPLGWRVDGHRGVKDPRGMFGRMLGVDLHVITAASDPLLNLISCVERCHLEAAGVVAAPYASGLGALVEDELELGAMIVDMGAHTTSMGVFCEGSLLHVDCLPIGGAHVTSDIARGLATPLSAADRIKVLYGSALDSPDDDQVMIETPPVGGDADAGMTQQPRALLNAVIRPRLEEIFEFIRDRADQAGVSKTAGRRLVLTGAAAQLPGACELAGRILNKQVRIGRPETLAGLGDAVSGPGFSACAGVIIRRARGPSEAIAGPPRFTDATERRTHVRAAGERGPQAFLRWFAESF